MDDFYAGIMRTVCAGCMFLLGLTLVLTCEKALKTMESATEHIYYERNLNGQCI